MNASSNTIPAQGRAWLFFAISLAFCFIIPSGSHLETDELLTAVFAQIKNCSEWLTVLTSCTGSDRQMPLTLFIDFAYEKIAGHSEWQLRSINILWGLITTTSFYLIGRRLKMVWLPLLMAVQPFYWYYMDQARPYAMLIACSSVVLYTVVCCMEDGKKWSNGNLFIFFFAGLLLSACNMMGFLGYIPFCVLLAWLLFRAKWKPNFGAWLIAGSFLLLLFLLGLYYLSTLGVAGGAKVHPVGAANILFPLHEFFGLSGLSPERFALRMLGRDGIGAAVRGLIPYLPWILPLVLSYVVIGVSYVLARKDKQELGLIGYSIGLTIAAFLIILVPAFVVKFPAWGRHFSAAFPCYVLTLGLVINQCKKTRLTQIAIGVLFLFLFASSCRQRFSSAYEREDFRSPTIFANEALSRNESVWWYADEACSRYYAIRSTNQPEEKDKALYIGVFCAPEKADEMDSLPAPDWIILSQRLYVDSNPTPLTRYLEQHQYKLYRTYPAFLIYKRSTGN